MAQDHWKQRLAAGARRSQAELKQLAQRTDRGVRRALGQRSCIALTGFSGAGKSTLLTSLINQILNHQVQQAHGLWPEVQGRWLSARLKAPGGADHYPFIEQVRKLRAGHWPASTEGLSRCLLEVRLKPRHRLQDVRGRGYLSHEVEIWDYPGEWLMDLPLAKMSYGDWVADSYINFNNEPRNALAPDLYQRLLDLDPASPFDPLQFDALFNSYREFLMQAKASGLHIVNPGRFLLPGADAAEIPAFVPLLGAYGKAQNDAAPNSWWGEMSRRYAHYVAGFVRPFLEQVFLQVDHQLVLVDLLGSLGQGRQSLNELRRSLARVLQLFTYGQNGWLDKLVAPKVEQLTFIATKLDAVLPAQRAHMGDLMRALVAESVQLARFESTHVDHMELAAISCTRVGNRNGEAALITERGGEPAWLAHPPLPRGWPTDTDWAQLSGWATPQLTPPTLGDPLQTAWPNIHMGALISHLLRELNP
ncbi:YcjX family protein [Simiduia sp. 21SJ11W-1]|uniref:YcjX family protein n=1 Tax=Simiduia sp. 21SJ11W-1 TaxID=2909669 RepID=UPI0020A1AC6C|nr:YcjX family protein [Simiduia sp. 21SJ11W-1]UTA47899.1 YcjX family protein [Simiduia sp. 21SJ11W-1]